MPTRRQLLIVAGAGAGAALAGPRAARAMGSSANQPIPVPQRLQRLVRLERLLLFCYEHILTSSLLTAGARRTLAPFPGQERAHIRALEGQLRAHHTAVPPGPADVHAANRDLAHRNIGGRLGQLKGSPDALRLLLTTEQVTIGAYYETLTTLEDPPLIELACSIMANEAQHDAMLALLLASGQLESAVPYGLVQGLH